MSTGFLSLDIAAKALRAQQKAVDVTAHNIANANTEGYSRKRVTFVSTSTATAMGRTYSSWNPGTGVEVAAVRRIRDALVDQQIREENALLGKWEATRDALQQIEMVFSEPNEAGLNNILNQFWNAWDEVGNSPESMAARTALWQRAANLASGFNRIYDQLRTIQKDLDNKVNLYIERVNELSEEIGRLNIQITKGNAYGDTMASLRDQRDILLDELSLLAKISYSENDNGSVIVHLGGRNLVSGGNTLSLVGEPNPSNGNLLDVKWASDSVDVNLRGGELSGALTVRDVTITQLISEFDDLAQAIITNVNSLHQAGYGLDGSTGVSFFSGSSSQDIAVASSIASDVATIAAASNVNSPGDGSNALGIAQLQHSLLMSSNTTTINEFYLSVITKLGLDTRESIDQAENQGLMMEYLLGRREEVCGVSLDEETINLIQYQRAYEAAARVVTVIDEMLDKIINGMGIVGR